jgi:hypothetical protein
MNLKFDMELYNIDDNFPKPVKNDDKIIGVQKFFHNDCKACNIYSGLGSNGINIISSGFGFSSFNSYNFDFWTVSTTKDLLKNNLLECINYLKNNENEILIEDEIIDALEDELKKYNLVLDVNEELSWEIYCDNCGSTTDKNFLLQYIVEKGKYKCLDCEKNINIDDDTEIAI